MLEIVLRCGVSVPDGCSGVVLVFVSDSVGFFEAFVAISPIAAAVWISCFPAPCAGSLSGVSISFAFASRVVVPPFSPELLLSLESEPWSCAALFAASRNFFLKSIQRASAFSRKATSSFSLRSSSRFFASNSLFLSLYRRSAEFAVSTRQRCAEKWCSDQLTSTFISVCMCLMNLSASETSDFI